MRFGVLGDVELRSGGRAVPLGRRRDRLLLGVLALHDGQVVPMSRLVELLWEGDPPQSARRSVHSHVARVRAVLQTAAALKPAAAPVSRVTARDGGYVLHAPDAEIDVRQFRRMLAEASATADPAGREKALRQALALWRGPVFGSDASDELRDRVCADLEALRLGGWEELCAALLATGRHDEALPELSRLAADHPSRERLAELRMMALHRAGLRAEALTAYQEIRTWLAEHLGVDPAPELQRLHLAMLRDEPLPIPEPPRTPAELPVDTTRFVGREADLAALDDCLRRDVRVVAVTGPAGVGKTSLAVRFARQVAHRFPDGQLHINLRGYDRSPPMSPGEALTRALTSLGARPEDIPTEPEAAAGRYRSHLAGRRILVLLDNAASAAQVRSLLPAESGCMAVVTSRDLLGGLAVDPGAERIVLGDLTPYEAGQLIAAMIGADRTAAEPDAAAELVELCAGLPLALRIAGANLAGRPAQSLADHVAALRADRLGALGVPGDVAVATSFGLSYARLGLAEQRLFRLLGVAPGRDADVPAAAALAGCDTAEAARLLDQLTTSHLLEIRTAGRVGFHDLLRLHACDLAERDGDEADRSAALVRLGEWRLARAAAAARVAYPFIALVPEADAQAERAAFRGPEQAIAWLEAERGNLVAAAEHAARYGPRRLAWLLANTLRGHFLIQPQPADATLVGEAARRAADAEGDVVGKAVAALSVAGARRWASPEAARDYETAAQLSRRAGWTAGVATSHNNAGSVYLDRGELGPAVLHLDAALAAFRELGDRAGEAVAVGNLGEVRSRLGRLGEAERDLRRALTLHQEGYGLTAHPLVNLADVCRLVGRPDEAVSYATEAVRLQQESGSRRAESGAHTSLAAAYCDAGRLDAAYRHVTVALRLAEEGTSPEAEAEAEAQHVAGMIHQARGEADEAWRAYAAALSQARALGLSYLEAAVLTGAAWACLALGREAEARSYATRARVLARDAGYAVREADALLVLAEMDREPNAAREHARAALARYRDTGCRPGARRAGALVKHVSR